jgi:hypothetical protein
LPPASEHHHSEHHHSSHDHHEAAEKTHENPEQLQQADQQKNGTPDQNKTDELKQTVETKNETNGEKSDVKVEDKKDEKKETKTEEKKEEKKEAKKEAKKEEKKDTKKEDKKEEKKDDKKEKQKEEKKDTKKEEKKEEKKENKGEEKKEENKNAKIEEKKESQPDLKPDEKKPNQPENHETADKKSEASATAAATVVADQNQNKSAHGSHKTEALVEPLHLPVTTNNLLAEESLTRIESQAVSRQSGQSEDLSDYIVSTANYKLFLLALVQFIIGEAEINDWMATNASALELENGAIMATSERHPPLISDSFAYGSKWVMSKIASGAVDMEAHNAEDMLVIEKSFQTGTRILYANIGGDLDSILLPLLYYKNSMNQASASDESRLILFSGRRLFCTPSFQLYLHTELPFSSFSPHVLTSCTPVSYQLSVENLIDIFQLKIFEALYPEEYVRRRDLLVCVKECNEKLESIDKMLKQKWDR